MPSKIIKCLILVEDHYAHCKNHVNQKDFLKNLGPVILLTILRKIVSIIRLKRVKPKYEDYLSQSQSACRSNRRLSDIVWAHWWIIAKIKENKRRDPLTYNRHRHVIRLKYICLRKPDRNSEKHTLPKDEDEVRMARLLFRNISLNINTKGVETESF